tara:strand:- start:213 stop:680 length:468 start_codon:yes stop_codon:yes gene_type:complete
MKIIGEDSCKTKCGHLFCTGCLLKAVQRNSSCPLCRGQLIENEEVVEDEFFDENELGVSMFNGDELDAASYYQTDYEQGRLDGRQEAEEEFQPRMREEIDIATQKAYDDGVVQGRSLASEDMRRLREDYEKKIEIMANEIKKLESEIVDSLFSDN